MSEATVNVAGLRAVLTAIAANQGDWHQDLYESCLAGWTVRVLESLGPETMLATYSNLEIEVRAADLLGLPLERALRLFRFLRVPLPHSSCPVPALSGGARTRPRPPSFNELLVEVTAVTGVDVSDLWRPAAGAWAR